MNTNYLLTNKEIYDRLAEEYNQKAYQYRDSQKRILQPLDQYLQREFGHGNRNVLDIGCGVGLNLITMEDFGYSTVGLDISPKMVAYAKLRSPHSKYYIGSLEQVSIEEKFHGIIMDAFIHCFPKKDAERMLLVARNLMYPGAVGTISTTYSEESKEGYFPKSDYSSQEMRFRKFWTMDELVESLTLTGFDVLSESRETNYGKDWIRLFFQNPQSDALENVLYICGMHATGKSIITKDLASNGTFVLHPRSGHSSSEEYVERLKYRIRIYHRDALEQMRMVESFPDKIILGDRAVFDGMAYVDTFLDLGWITTDEHQDCYSLFDELFPFSLLPRNLIFVNPPLDWNIQRMQERWKTEGVRWREDDPAFLPAAKERFNAMYNSKRLKHLNIKALNLTVTDHHARIREIIEWMIQNNILI